MFFRFSLFVLPDLDRGLDGDVVLSGLGGKGVLLEIVEVGVSERDLGGDPLLRVVDEHGLEEVEAGGVEELLHVLAEAVGGPAGEGGLVVRQRGHARPDLLGGRPQDAEDPEELVDLGVTWKWIEMDGEMRGWLDEL